MAESVLEVVGKLQSRLAGSSEPKKVTGVAGRPGLPPFPMRTVRRSLASGGPGPPYEGSGAGAGRAWSGLAWSPPGLP